MSDGSRQQASTLRDIADEAKLSMADVAFLANLPKSTLSRLWDEEDWLDRITGRSLKQLVSVLPGLTAHVSRQSWGPRLRDTVRDCMELGLQVRMERVRALVASGCPAQRVVLTLETAAAVMRLDARAAASYLARCWGAGHDTALDALLTLSSSPQAILADSVPLLDRVSQLLPVLKDKRGGSSQAVVGHGILVHKTAKLFGQTHSPLSAQNERGGAFTHRSAAIGLLLGTGDLDVAVEYQRAAEQSPLLRANELWPLATYARDAAQTSDFALSKATALTKTATEIAQDASALNEAYLYYLASTAVPTLLRHDPTFGGIRPQLAKVLSTRLEAGLESDVERACATLVKSLAKP